MNNGRSKTLPGSSGRTDPPTWERAAPCRYLRTQRKALERGGGRARPRCGCGGSGRCCRNTRSHSPIASRGSPLPPGASYGGRGAGTPGDTHPAGTQPHSQYTQPWATNTRGWPRRGPHPPGDAHGYRQGRTGPPTHPQDPGARERDWDWNRYRYRHRPSAPTPPRALTAPRRHLHGSNQPRAGPRRGEEGMDALPPRTAPQRTSCAPSPEQSGDSLS